MLNSSNSLAGGEVNSERSSSSDQYSKCSVQSPFLITLKFSDVSYKVKLSSTKPGRTSGGIRNMFTAGGAISSDIENPAQDRTILKGITGMASPGKILAILGPSGSGKSTLLNALAGRLGHGHGLTGTILFNDRRLSKPVVKKTGFVTQDDMLYPHLTVRETLIFCALLRLPNSTPKDGKICAADSVIAELGLSKCANTIVGNSLIRGISGGERKRVSIAHELLIDPSLLILDEPTSGLDSTAAYRLISTVGGLAAKGKTVVASVHQPSSRVFQMFDDLLVLSEGRCIYFGKGSQGLGYFESLGFSPCFPMNPADFMLDLANGVCQLEGSSEKEKPSVIRHSLITSYNDLLAPKVISACTNSTAAPTTSPAAATDPNKRRRRYSQWFNQLTILLQRNLKERKHETFNSLRVFQVIAASLLSSFMWWHSDYNDIHDRLGLLFVITIFWGVFPSFNAVFAFPQERAIVMKERASGMYTLSAYFTARIAGDLPMELILPTLFLSIVYWTTGLKPDFPSFALTLIVSLGYVLVSQGLGLALGAVIMDAKKASTVITVTMLAFVLTGGYYVHKVPYFVSWIKYVSSTFYCYKLLVYVQYGDGVEAYMNHGCSSGRRDTSTCIFIDEDIRGQIHPAICVSVLFIMFVGYRLLAYMGLRRVGAS